MLSRSVTMFSSRYVVCSEGSGAACIHRAPCSASHVNRSSGGKGFLEQLLSTSCSGPGLLLCSLCEEYHNIYAIDPAMQHTLLIHHTLLIPHTMYNGAMEWTNE